MRLNIISTRTIPLVVCCLLLILLLVENPASTTPSRQMAYVYGIIVLLILWSIYWVLGGTPNPSKLVEGADGRPSASKLQFFLWTVVVIFSYIFFSYMNGWAYVDDIPHNVLIAMGLSLTTAVAAKGITSSYVANGQVAKTAVSGPTANNVEPKAIGARAIFQDDDGIPDLSKVQMMAWTFIAIGIYLFRIVSITNPIPAKLPDIDTALMVLMGLGQGAYLGKKLTTTDTARLTGLSPGSGIPETKVTIFGISFGESQNGSLITINGNPFHLYIPREDWKDTQIKFKIPSKHPTGRDWSAQGELINIGLIVGGQESANKLPFTVGLI